jgi:hypothetical protein
MRRLAPLTNVIPVIAQAETLSPEQLKSLKANIICELREASIRPFLFGASPEEVLSSSKPLPPFAVSTVTTSDHENMDASLLMSPDYVQPLVATELASLVEKLFDRDTVSWLRHSAAKKCVQWRKGLPQDQELPRSLSLQSSYSVSGNRSQILTPLIGATSSYALARLTDHTQHEERLAQVRLSKWASDLQRSLRNERVRFEALARGERAVWLTERLNECVQDGTLVPISSTKSSATPSSSSGPMVKQGTYSRRAHRVANLDRHDPLGLLQLNAEMQRKSWAALQIVGGFGIIGGLTIWLAGKWNDGSAGDGSWAYAWGWDWGKLVADW